MNEQDGKAFVSQQAFDNPHVIFQAMREQSPVCQIGNTRAFLVGSHQAVTDAVMRPEDFSSNLDAMLACIDDGDLQIVDLTNSGAARNVIATADEPDHKVQRRLLMPSLKASKIEILEDDLRQFAGARVAEFVEKGRGNICENLAESLPAYVVMRLLGLPDDSLKQVQRWAMMGGDFLAGRFNSSDLDTVLTETAALSQFLSDQFNATSSKPKRERGESMTALLVSGVEDGLVSVEQAVGIMVILFGAAGESTASLLGSALRILAEDPAMQTRLRNSPELIPPFIEEVVRVEAPFKFHYRIVKKDCELCEVKLKEGDLLLIGWAAANRDPEVWDKPDDIILQRDKSTRNFGFGYGSHFCIGAPLARMEVRVALEELLAATRHFEIDAENPYEFCPSILVRRLLHLHLLAS